MNRTEKLVSALAASSKAEGGIHTIAELAYLTNTQATPSFRKLLIDCAKKGILRRLANGLYESTLTPPDPSKALYKTANKLRDGHLNYISLESQLSHTGDISQIPMDRITLMTSGRSGTFKTAYGTLEFTHTKKPQAKLVDKLYFDHDIQMFRASTEQALADLKSCGRNLHMLDAN
jgi:predicted transcriptional regulator of viral defense system